MNHYPILNAKDRILARTAWCFLRSVMNRAEHPKLRSSLAQWSLMLRETLKNPP